MFEDDYRYEDEADDFEYIDDDEEEDENALWDDDAADAEISEPPDKIKRSRFAQFGSAGL